jgi:hypothetical protein
MPAVPPCAAFPWRRIAVFYRDDAGNSISVLTTEDLAGGLIRRRLCEINEFNDVRTCRDWDTQETAREMKNDGGFWVRVE